MRRRSFLKQAGISIAGAAAVADGHTAAEVQGKPSEAVAHDSSLPCVLITSAETGLARQIADELKGAYRVRLSVQSEIRTEHEYIQSELGPDEATADLVRAVDAIVHVADPPAEATGAELLDYRTRCTYNLLQAAAREKVRLLVYVSSIQLLTGYPADFAIDESWRPVPGDRPEPLSSYLGEFVCREFARQQSLRVVVLRLGTVVRAEAVEGQPFDPMWVDQADVVQAIRRALQVGLSETTRLGMWSVFHILSDSPRARFSVQAAKRSLGYQPRFRG